MTSTAAVAAVHFLAALTLALALSRPVLSSEPDRYRDEAQATDSERQKRAFISWAEFDGLGKWKAPLVQISRPYYIPVYGAPGKVPIYFPPQRLNFNPGVPADNPVPKRPFVAPGYLPPAEETTTMKLSNRFNEDEDALVFPSESNEQEIIPTRPPPPPGMDTSEFPPLVHDINSAGNNPVGVEAAPLQRSTTVRSITAGPSNCAWAIITCCSVSTTVVPDKCFEQRGCPGPFWGSSPCESEFAKSAIASALNFYANNNQ